MLYPIDLQGDTSFVATFASDPWIYRIGVNPAVFIPVALEIVMIMPRNKTVKLKTPGLTLKRKILGVWAQSPHEEASHFFAYPCTDSYEEPLN